ncbi:HAMP domain-containing sensor histidine kinase [Planomicrobium sp. CPCC 101110]|uniref:HAMP domain-containing sensor histidine kinase n=1 Tax=Planomicrobium sp. CPCC 101110 TaxID=2599619 RepID=UPI0011B7CEB1|nr:HAMP domain-containing sensor histidine kinase [Planomicrobium sp. CPCC 101110]TWT25755.1 HAMP domain-containing histidine kinase [Planomicrobium sp. CPCC 101110]
MTKDKTAGRRLLRKSLFSFYRYLIFFLLIAFVVTCSFFLFLNSIDIKEELIIDNASTTFFNILFLTLVFTLIDGLRRKITVERPVKRILEMTHRISEGDFNINNEPFRTSGKGNEFDLIIENFNKMAKELSGIETLRTDFVANVSHELKTPLAIIQNYGTMLQAPDLADEKRLEYAKGLTEASRRLADLITNILKLNRLENQQIFPEEQKYDLGEQLCECFLSFESIWEKKNLEIETDIAEDIAINADPELMSLVWNNLLSNAIKFTKPGGRISVSLKSDNDTAVVQISDTGCGMSAEVGAHIFERFYQGDTSHATQGNGLGLALVKRVIDIMKGEISVQSKLGEGSTFIVRLRRRTDGAGQENDR